MRNIWNAISDFFDGIKDFIFKNYSSPIFWAVIVVIILLIVSFAMSRLKEK